MQPSRPVFEGSCFPEAIRRYWLPFDRAVLPAALVRIVTQHATVEWMASGRSSQIGVSTFSSQPYVEDDLRLGIVGVPAMDDALATVTDDWFALPMINDTIVRRSQPADAVYDAEVVSISQWRARVASVPGADDRLTGDDPDTGIHFFRGMIAAVVLSAILAGSGYIAIAWILR